ncbi:flagellar hook-associated protein FlgL [Pseudomonas lijiangensis]|uniref:Flagellar hook-associated protein FlgL n=1 Tax=Pseudomonas lijiangensis TaxID=2995658 RepID=A0ABX8HST9_9PSED|nr:MULTISPECIES: flagellar hook-associated protein FlgL [Pseudomonas syringae group]MBX8501129.1 flagellar hook-associated protein FlgL [Pseudomonas lijiangensis]MBX8505963.1 flagellar hook-associated protein FlgL [Pseudomonas lijiangensis]MBX8520649.1 flagellar hook-associated protein FlgL [Pseudomonas cichorii]MBX8554096.1 flagellar hook-associated protein FlgL [Pseudomonas cichorii]MBX8602087.1 flagellar hook-associated protein FlgL [Pseudomonas cichorii]
MRLSSATIYNQSLSSMLAQESAYQDAAQEVSSGTKVVTPSDDSLAAAQAVNVRQAIAANEQYADSRSAITTSLSQEESTLDSINDAISSAMALVVQANNGTLSDADRESIATSLQGVYDTLVTLANSTDSNGNYLFSGYQSQSPAFAVDADGNMTYQGDDNVVTQQVSSTQTMASSDNGATIFLSVSSSAGYIAEAGDNTGTVTFDGPDITDSTDANYGTGFTLTFSTAEDGTAQYSIDGADPVAYTDGETLEINGLSLTLEGTPADGDTITVSAATDADPDLFATLKNLITALQTPVETEADQAALSNTLSTSSRQLSNAQDNVLTVQTSVGSRLNQIEVLDTIGDDLALSYAERLSGLVDADYTESVTEYTSLQVALQAAQQTFVSIQKMSLFEYI